MRRVIVNSVGKMVRTLDDVEAVPGKPVQLTIDYDLQAIAEADLAGKEGAVIAMDPRNGDRRSQRFCGAHSRGRMAEAQQRSGNAAHGSRDSGAARAWVRIQNNHGHRDARIQDGA